MARKQLGKLPPRYSFILNPHLGTRLSKCPICKGLTHLRKFALFIHVNGFGPVLLGKTCRYCTPCELVMVHRNELNAELARSPAQLPLDADDTSYFVVGTVDKKFWQKGLKPPGTTVGEIFDHMADFKKHFDLGFDPGGWRRADET